MHEYYIKVNKNTKIIEDVITYPHTNYIKIILDERLNYPIHIGYYKYLDGQITIDEIRKAEIEAEISRIEEEMNAIV